VEKQTKKKIENELFFLESNTTQENIQSEKSHALSSVRKKSTVIPNCNEKKQRGNAIY